MDMMEAVQRPFLDLGAQLMNGLPGILAAILILILGYFVAFVLSKVVGSVLHRLHLDRYLLQRTNLEQVIGEFQLSKFVELITKWYVFILFIPSAAALVNLSSVQMFLNDVARWIPQVILGVVIGLIGIMTAEYVALQVQETRARAARVLALSAKVIILVFTFIIALEQMGVKVDLARSSVLIVLGGIMLGLALMMGIGFGLALKDDAKKMISDIKKKL